MISFGNRFRKVHKTAQPVTVEAINASKKQQEEPYPCLCKIVRSFLIFGRVVGILPVISLNLDSHKFGCRFIVSKGWLIYSYVLQATFGFYMLIIYSLRFYCGPNKTNSLQWYVMTYGYFMSDMDSLCSLICGVILSQKTCTLLERMSLLPYSSEETQAIKRIWKTFMKILLSSYFIMFTSYSCGAFLRQKFLQWKNYNCSFLDLPLAVVMRATVTFVSTIELAQITMFCVLIISKYKYLKEKTIVAMELCSVMTISGNVTTDLLSRLESEHKEISSCMKQFNNLSGCQILMATCSCLYSTVYYLYRYSTSSKNTVASNKYETGHYIIGAVFRAAKLIHYMFLGHQITTNSVKPLQVLQNAKLINLPFKMQQQVQTLILQWSSKREYLSALNVVKVGPWLLAPITGSVITYLLVALQFDSSVKLTSNFTSRSF